jgi:hypothetical protein
MAITRIATVTVGAGGAASLDFNSIPGTATDLMLVYSLRAAVSNGGLRLKVNGATTNLTVRLLYGTGSSAASATDTTYIGTTTNSGTTSNTFGNGTLYIPNYAGATTKSFSADVVTEGNYGTPWEGWVTAGLYNSTTAITSLSLFNDAAGNFAQYSTATLYGVTKGSLAGVTVS